MTETEFRIEYSRLIEYYQYIEMRLRFLCAEILADRESEWYANLNKYYSDSFGMLINRIVSLQIKNKVEIINQDEIKNLDEMRIARNYWVHNVFSDDFHVTFNKKDELRYPYYKNRLTTDLSNAVEWDEKLTDMCRNFKNTHYSN